MTTEIDFIQAPDGGTHLGLLKSGSRTVNLPTTTSDLTMSPSSLESSRNFEQNTLENVLAQIIRIANTANYWPEERIRLIDALIAAVLQP